MWSRYISKIRRVLPKRNGHRSFAQCGEDSIARFVLIDCLGRRRGTYLDLGANEPIVLNNTYLFYLERWRGVCVEPNEAFVRKIRRARPRDVCLEAGVGFEASQGVSDFYVMDPPTLSTFSCADAKRIEAEKGGRVESVRKVPLMTINDIIETHLKCSPDFVSLDVEGLDLQVLQNFDFVKFRPAVFCVETLSYSGNRTESKLNEVAELMRARDYLVYADTYINTLFVDRSTWQNR